MAVPSGYSRNIIRGHLEGGEIFEWGFWIAEAPSNAAAANTQAAAIATAYTSSAATGTPPANFLSSTEGIDEVRVYSYVTGGTTADFVGSAPLVVAGSSVSTMPNQVAIVVTLETGFSGRRNRGRYYLPCSRLATLTLGQIPSATVTAIALNAKTFLDAVNSAAGQPVSVLSQVAGSAKPVTAVRVDSKFDIQRRRANREPASFTQLTAL